MCVAKLGNGGRITIPGKVRRDLGLTAGDRVSFVKQGSEILIARVKRGSIMDLHGIVKWKGKPVTIEQMNETIRRGWAGLLRSED